MANILEYLYPKNRFIDVAKKLASDMDKGKVFLNTDEFPEGYKLHYESRRRLGFFFGMFIYLLLPFQALILLAELGILIAKIFFNIELDEFIEKILECLRLEVNIFTLLLVCWTLSYIHGLGKIKRITRRSS